MNNYSKQREIVLEILKNTKVHPTVDEIYQEALKKESKISRSTIYRNINVLVENGTIKRITIPNKPDRYDYFGQIHHHAVCTECGKVYDFQYDFDIETIEKKIKKQINVDFSVENVKLVGICENCKSK